MAVRRPHFRAPHTLSRGQNNTAISLQHCFSGKQYPL